MAWFGRDFIQASSFSFRAAAQLALAGMAKGIFMAASGNHSIMPAHAHLNLLGWVSLFLFGIYYRFHPTVDLSRLAVIQVSAWTFGTVIMTIGVTLIYLGMPEYEPLATVGSLVVLAAMAIFAVIVFRSVPVAKSATSRLNPAE
jgi:hypothetical protein